MSAAVVESPGTVTAWAVAHWLAEGPDQRAVVIAVPGSPDAHTRDALNAEHRNHQAEVRP